MCATGLVVSCKAGDSGKSEAVCPSVPIPRMQRSNGFLGRRFSYFLSASSIGREVSK